MKYDSLFIDVNIALLDRPALFYNFLAKIFHLFSPTIQHNENQEHWITKNCVCAYAYVRIRVCAYKVRIRWTLISERYCSASLMQSFLLKFSCGTLSKPSDMGHIWPKHGNDMAWTMSLLWVMYGFCMGCCFPYQAHRCHCILDEIIILS